jgi:molybdopterin/thiamine biosynthesis adenylyltransferase
MNQTELHSRHAALVPPATRELTVLIAGAGMVGSWTALALCRMVKAVHIWDFDDIEAGNIGVQAYTQGQIGMNKAIAIEEITLGLPVIGHPEKFDTDFSAAYQELEDADILILSVDSMEARRNIAAWCNSVGHIGAMIDTRVLGEIACIHTVLAGDYEDYLATLPTDGEVREAPCGARGTAFAGMWLAARVAAIVNNLGRGMPPPPKLVFHVGLNMEVTA